MTPNQWAAFMIALLGFSPVVAAGSDVQFHSPQHRFLLSCFFVGLCGFGWLVSLYRR